MPWRKSVQNMINVFERWCYRRMLRISWTEHVTNEEVFNRANTKPTLLDGLLKKRLAFHGHLVRKGGITLDLMIGRLHGTRPRGRPRTTWLKDLATQANISCKEAITIPRDRKKWRSVGNPRRTPDEWVSECTSLVAVEGRRSCLLLTVRHGSHIVTPGSYTPPAFGGISVWTEQILWRQCWVGRCL